MATQDGNLERRSIQEIDYTKDQIALLLAAQTNDHERCALAEKIILELVKKNERLLQEKEIERKQKDILLAMSEKQLIKIQILEKQLQAVNEHPGANNIKKTPAFVHENRLSDGSLRKSLPTITPRSDVKREVMSTPRRPARVQRQDSMTITPATTTSALVKLGRMVIEQLQNSGGDIRQIQDSMRAIQGPHETATQRVSISTLMETVQGTYETSTRRVSMSNSGGAVQTSRNANGQPPTRLSRGRNNHSTRPRTRHQG
jgi:hypothetical protein